jgi:hypothetical protein
MDSVRSQKAHRYALWKAVLLFLLVAVLLTIADQLSLNLRLDGWQRLLDDLVGGLVAGSIFYLHEYRRLRRLQKQLLVIDLMNHHIRNALQPIMFVAYQDRPRMKLIQGCVNRIDWALREVLTGKSQEQFAPSTPTIARSDPDGPGSPFLYGLFDAWKTQNHRVLPARTQAPPGRWADGYCCRYFSRQRVEHPQREQSSAFRREVPR